MARKESDYFRSLKALADYACQTADLLPAALEGTSRGAWDSNLEKIRQYRKKSEAEHSFIRQRLKTDFITPLEREDIWSIAFSITDITEKAEEGMFSCCLLLQGEGLTGRPKEILAELSRACAAGSRAVEVGVGELKNHRESRAKSRCLSEIKRLRGGAEELVRGERRAAAERVAKFGKPAATGLFEETAGLLLDCVKACEKAVMTMELASIKN